MQKQRLLSAIGRQQAPATAAEQVLPGRREWSSSEKIYQRSRTRPGTAPLARGKKLYARVSVAVESIEAGEAELLADQSLDGGVVHVAASGLALRGCLLRVLTRYRREHPHVRICLTNHSTPQGLTAVQNGLADFAVVSEGSAVPDSLTKQRVGRIQEVPVCTDIFPELLEGPVTLAQLAAYPIISLTDGTSSHSFYVELFLRNRLPFHPDIEVETIDQVLPVVLSGLGVGFVPREMLVGPAALAKFPVMRYTVPKPNAKEIRYVSGIQPGDRGFHVGHPLQQRTRLVPGP